MNTDQVRAVRRSLGSDTTFVWGPPGTGKTSTLARVVEAHWRAGRSVLLVSNTNIAVDTALERIAERLKGEPEFHQGLVIRHGPVEKNELRERFGKQIILKEIAARLGESLAREKEQLSREAMLLETQERVLVAALKDIERLANARQALWATERALEATSSKIATLEREVDEYRSEAGRLRRDLERARTMGAIRRFFSGLDPERLARDVTAADRAADARGEAARAVAGDLPKLHGEIVMLRAEVDRLLAETQVYPPEPQVRSQLAMTLAGLSRVRERIGAIDQESATLEEQVISRCRILATTVYRSYLGKKALRRFDAVVIDEASMLMPPLVYYAAGMALQSVTVAGDFRQLPPIVLSDEKLAEEWLKRDVFEIVGIPQRLARRQPTPQLVSLGTQYRMREPICAVINELFYADHPLHSDASVSRPGTPFPLGSAPLLYVDTSPFHPWTSLRIGTYSRYNLLHALLVRNIILHLAESDFLPRAGEPNDAVGVVSPYAAQAHLIQSLLSERIDNLTGIAATVHRFQGNEKAVMVLDLTDSPGAHLGRFLKASRLDEDGARLLNVAASRARHHVVLVGHFDYLREKAPRDAFVRRLVDYFKEHGTALDSGSLLPLAERDWVDGLHHTLPPTFHLAEGAAGAFSESTFYPAFMTDLCRTRESLVIFSPFATIEGTGRWVNLLRTALARGIRVRIITRAPGQGALDGAAESVRMLLDLGVGVDLRARMHEKIAIVDGHILWHGSLNVLSHANTHESMLRIDSAVACEQVGRFLTTPARRGNEPPKFDEPENPKCPRCGSLTVWNNGCFGIWYECSRSDCGGKVDSRSGAQVHGRTKAPNGPAGDRGHRTKAASGDARECRPCPQTGCGGQLVERRGRYGRFLGCTNHPACKYTENPR